MLRNAALWVNRLLESSYDIDDPLDKPGIDDFPIGFVAARGTDAKEFRLEEFRAKNGGYFFAYRLTTHWIDEYTGHPRTLKTHQHRVRDPQEAADWIKTEAERWAEHGWKIKFL